MVLLDKGNGKDIEFGHTDYRTNEGRPVTHGENEKERYINPELTVKERHRMTVRDSKRRNQYKIYLSNENNTQIVEYAYYNPFTEALSLSWSVVGNHGKRLLYINDSVGK